MPRPTRTFTLVTDPAEAQAWFADLVSREPEALSVVASVTEGLVVDRNRYRGPRWWATTDGSGEVVGAFMHTPPHPLHIALASADEARDLAALLVAQRDVLPGVGGQRGPAEAFATEWVARTGATSRVAMEVGRFDLPTRPHVPFQVSGSFRLATEADTALVDDWHQRFVEAIDGVARVVPSLDRHVASGRVGLWEDAGRAVSMAYASTANGGVTRISGVWTPPDLRGRGYASGVVAALSADRLDAGESCMLYTDLANPTSNAIYTAMGYRRVGDSISIAFGARV
ncbi:GNAT family N-acetyltransferase [Terracoccus sp. 273MFTsu3.1]|uniref:GNAT family N-acetyltransferase n=1 Tax=Terracoccus sp. 273MFTsu3.1 TaxID=1172188 RepID=UPI00037F75D8|nr:GNAT family N-acetyltransferase [Terracoccus sp. 273MFTsu3.1]